MTLCETGNFEGYDSLIEMNRNINDSEVRSRIDKVKNGKSRRSGRNFERGYQGIKKLDFKLINKTLQHDF